MANLRETGSDCLILSKRPGRPLPLRVVSFFAGTFGLSAPRSRRTARYDVAPWFVSLSLAPRHVRPRRAKPRLDPRPHDSRRKARPAQLAVRGRSGFATTNPARARRKARRAVQRHRRREYERRAAGRRHRVATQDSAARSEERNRRVSRDLSNPDRERTA